MSSSFDLSNQFNVGSVIANGDYTYTPGCPDLGCEFPGSSGQITDQSFGSRFRGFFDVKPEWAGQPMAALEAPPKCSRQVPNRRSK